MLEDGFLNINKPRGPTSHDVVRTVKRLLCREKKYKIGHTGTLDPPACGVLILAVGRANRLVEYVLMHPKEYTGLIRLGSETDTLDAAGKVTGSSPVPDFTQSQLDEISPRFTGKIMQVPPAVSALKKDGMKYYVKARRGMPEEPPSREAYVYDLILKQVDNITVSVYVRCASGFYVRSLARDIARGIGTMGHLDHLVRTTVGAFKLEDSIELEWIENNGVEATLNRMERPEFPLDVLPRFDIPETEISFFKSGMIRWIENENNLPQESDLAVYSRDGFLGIGQLVIEEGKLSLRPRKVIDKKIPEKEE